MSKIEDNRLELHEILCDILESRNVYYQPPESIKMKYPAIIYNRNSIDNSHADNSVYMQDYSYTVTVIDTEPDSEIVEKISKLPKCRYDRGFKSDNMYHDVFKIYY